VIPVSHAEPEPRRDLFPLRKHKFIGASFSLRDGLLEEIDRVVEEVPYSSRSDAVAMLIALGL
jgi:hypothetical protein